MQQTYDAKRESLDCVKHRVSLDQAAAALLIKNKLPATQAST